MPSFLETANSISITTLMLTKSQKGASRFLLATTAVTKFLQSASDSFPLFYAIASLLNDLKSFQLFNLRLFTLFCSVVVAAHNPVSDFVRDHHEHLSTPGNLMTVSMFVPAGCSPCFLRHSTLHCVWIFYLIPSSWLWLFCYHYCGCRCHLSNMCSHISLQLLMLPLRSSQSAIDDKTLKLFCIMNSKPWMGLLNHFMVQLFKMFW